MRGTYQYHKVKVTGRGHFPLDMLRYDQLFPATERDSGLIALGRLEKGQTIDLAGYHHKGWEPTGGRWESFLWRVVDHEVIK